MQWSRLVPLSFVALVPNERVDNGNVGAERAECEFVTITVPVFIVC